MIHPLRLVTQYIHDVENSSLAESIFCLIPVVNNGFVEVKRFQLQERNKTQLKITVATASKYLWWQVIWAPVLAKIQRCLSFTLRTTVCMGLAVYYTLADRHLEWLQYKL